MPQRGQITLEPVGIVKTWSEVNGLTEYEMRFYLYEVSLVMAAGALILTPMATVVSCIGEVMDIDTVQRHEHLFITTVMNIDLQT